MSLFRILPPERRWLDFLRAADRKCCGVHGHRTSRLNITPKQLTGKKNAPLFEVTFFFLPLSQPFSYSSSVICLEHVNISNVNWRMLFCSFVTLCVTCGLCVYLRLGQTISGCGAAPVHKPPRSLTTSQTGCWSGSATRRCSSQQQHKENVKYSQRECARHSTG